MKTFVIILVLVICTAGWSAPASLPFRQKITFDGLWQAQWDLRKDQAIDISLRIDNPSALPPNARIEARWEGPAIPELNFEGKRGDLEARATTSWQKTLHSLDPDLYLVYRAPRAGSYSLRL